MPQQTIERAGHLMTEYLNDLKTIVNVDSGTYTKSGVDRVGAYLQERFQAFGFSTHSDQQEHYGNHLIASRTGRVSNGPRLLLIGHMDTVFVDGEAQKRPFTISQQDGTRIAKGPGILDMKAGLLIGIYGLHLLAQVQQDNYQRVTFLCNSDEEIGSPSSKLLVQKLAGDADVVLVLEPCGRGIGTVVSSRPGIGNYRVEVRGVSAHAGAELHRGRNAIHELSYHIQALQALNGTILGTTLNVGVIHGGERPNIVPDYAYCDVDFRACDQTGMRAMENAIRQATAKTVLEGTQTQLHDKIWHQPFERTEAIGQLVQLAKEVGSELGVTVEETSNGAGSDGNTTAAMGIPTLDGLGAVGDYMHNPDEYIELDSLPTRIALLVGLIERIGTR